MEQPELENKKYIRASEAATRSGYTPDYITRLAREGKVVGEKIGRQWMVSVTSLDAFVASIQREKVARNESIREERKREQQQGLVAHAVHRSASSELASIGESFLVSGRAVALLQTCIILVAGLSFGLASQLPLRLPESSPASVSSSGVSFLEYLAVRLYTFVHPGSVKVASTIRTNAGSQADLSADTSSGTLPDVISSGSYHIEIISPAEGAKEKQQAVHDAFSDQVVIGFDPNTFDSGTVTPQFRDAAGQPYRFVLANPNDKTN